MSKLIRSQHFKDYVEKMYITCYEAEGYSEQAARDAFKDKFYDDFALLSWILDSIFIDTRRDGDRYIFVSGPVTHRVIEAKKGTNRDLYGKEIVKPEINIGRVEFWMDRLVEKFNFPDLPGFKHGHIGKESISCYGGYLRFYQELYARGFSSALMSMYNFASVSRYGTSLNGELTYV